MYELLKLCLDLHEDASGNYQTAERFDRTRGVIENINHTFMRAHLELLTAFLVDMRAAQHRVSLDPGRHWNGAAHAGVGALRVLHDLLGRHVQRPVIVCFHSDSDSGLLAHSLPDTFKHDCDCRTGTSAVLLNRDGEG